jgi:hypothetical protein
MMEYVFNNLDKIFIGFISLCFFEISQKYYNLKYYNKYNNLNIKKQYVYYIEIYKKKSNSIFINNYNRFYNKYYNYTYITDFKINKVLNSLTIVSINENKYKIYKDVLYKTSDFITYDNKYLKIINNNLKNKINDDLLFYILNKYKHDNDIKYKIIEKNTYLFYDNNDNDILQSIDDIKSNLLFNIVQTDLSLIYFYIILYLFLCKLKKN